MEIKTKYISRKSWRRIFSSVSAYGQFCYPSLCGVAGLLRLDGVREPLEVRFKDETMIIADNGYYWLQIAPKKEKWWLTVMYDGDGKCLQYYFDATLENIIDGENSRFRDLFLDLVAVPDGRLIILDGDELDDALSEGVITADEHKQAWDTVNALADGIRANYKQLDGFCQGFLSELKAQLC